ncbi:phosphoribosylamine--glycine ligase [Bacteroidota bacterium]
MNILVLGNGGREHAICWLISKSSYCTKLVIAPGNAGTAQLGQNININPSDFEAVKDLVNEHQIDLVVVGPEDPIVNGIYDFFKGDEELMNVPILAPSAAGARLEGSKKFAKEFMQRHHIPTAAYASFTSGQYAECRDYLAKQSIPIVIKADGLAAGKGVTVAFKREEAESAIDDLFLNNKFGEAGSTVVIEEFLEGIELSVFALTDGKSYVLLPEAKDYKQIGEGNTGPNTGGMGSISPVPFANKEFMQKVTDRVILPTIQGFQNEQIDYKGFVFFGLMNVKGEPYVIEYNVRLGDPETEAILPRIGEDILPYMLEAAQGKLNTSEIKITTDYSATVMLVSGGYPGDYEKGNEIKGLENVSGSTLFIAGAKTSGGKTITSGGRVLAVNSQADSLQAALDLSYKNAAMIQFDNMYYRRDLGKDLMG